MRVSVQVMTMKRVPVKNIAVAGARKTHRLFRDVGRTSSHPRPKSSAADAASPQSTRSTFENHGTSAKTAATIPSKILF